jgi:hypothetical protein
LLFIGLWSFADDSGRGRGALAALSGALFPYDGDMLKKLPSLLDELAKEKMVRLYKAEDGNTYYEVLNWLKHQKIEKPSKSKFPPFPEHSPNTPRNVGEISPLDQGTGTNGTGTNGGGCAPEGAARTSSRFVEPSLDEVKLAMAKAGLPESEAQAFVNYHAARGWMLGKSKMKSWPHAVGTWAQNYRTGFNGNHHRTVAEERNSFIGQPGCEGDEADVPFV